MEFTKEELNEIRWALTRSIDVLKREMHFEHENNSEEIESHTNLRKRIERKIFETNK